MSVPTKRPTKPSVKRSPTPASTRDTSPTVAKSAAKLMHDASAEVRKVAASALAQVEKVTKLPVSGLIGDKVNTRAFDPTDLRTTILTQCVGEIAFNYDNERDVSAALGVVANMDGYTATAKGLHVVVRRQVDG